MINYYLLSPLSPLLKSIFTASFGLVLSLMLISPGNALIEMDQLSSPELSARYRQLIEEYRCPKCQNQNLAGSDSPISADLRREIRRMLEEGANDEQISDYLVARYGDFVLYRPRLKQGTYLLWLGPGFLLLVGLSVAGWVISSQRAKTTAHDLDAELDNHLNNPAQPSVAKLSDAEQQRLNQLLTESGDSLPDSSTDNTKDQNGGLS